MGDFEREGIAVFAISYDPVDVLSRFAEKHSITFELLSDEGSRVIRDLGLLNERVYEQHAAYGVQPQDRHWGTPYPGSFLLDENGVVVGRRFYQSYRERETGAGVLASGFGGTSSIRDAEIVAESEGVIVRAWLDSGSYRYFQRLRLSVELEISPGLHIYGQPIPEGYIPLSVEIAPIDGLEVGAPEMPEARPFLIEGLDEQFSVYESKVLVTLPLTFTKRDAGDLLIDATVRFQACSASDCLMPATVQVQLPVVAAANVG
jgi:hypothetical protein